MTRPSLTRRFVLTLLLSAAVPMVAFGWFALAGMRERMERRIGDVYLPQLAADAGARIASLLDQVRRSLALLVAPATAALEEPGRVADFEAQVMLLPGLHEDFDLVLLARADGGIVRAQFNPRLDPETRAARLALLPPEVGAQPWHQALQAGRGEAWVDRHLSPFLHRSPDRVSRDPAEHHLGLALPVPARGPGSLFALVRWERVQAVLDDTAVFLRAEGQAALPSAHCFLADAGSRVLAHTDRARYGGQLEPPALRAQVTGTGRGAVAFVDAAGEERRGGVAAVAGLPGGLRWWFGLDAREAELFTTSREFARLLAATIAVLLAVLLVWSVIASRAIVRPVRELARATERIAGGDLEVRVRGGTAELAELGAAFNLMAEQLVASREQLRAAERQAAWAEMARQVAHEIKNPLTPMRLSAQLLQRARREGDPRWPELADRLARTVQAQTDALAAIAAEFRQFAGPRPRARERVPIGPLLEEVAGLVKDAAAAQGVVVEVLGAEAAPAVEADPQELRRVFLNLVQNGLEARGTRVLVQAREADGHVEVTVTDDGGGVPAEARERLFEPYFTSKSSGTGLGLAICKRIVEAHGGEIALRGSRPGETTFAVRLPRAG